MPFKIEREIAQSADESALQKIVDEIFDSLGPNPTEKSLLNKSEYHQLKKKKDLSHDFMSNLRSKLLQARLEQQVKYWERRIQKIVEKTDHKVTFGTFEYIERTDIEMDENSREISGFYEVLSTYSRENRREEVDWIGTRMMFNYPHEDQWLFRLVLALPTSFAQLKLGKFKEILMTFSLVMTRIRLTEGTLKGTMERVFKERWPYMDGWDLDTLFWLSLEDPKNPKTWIYLALANCVKGAAFIGLAESKIGLEYFLVGKKIFNFAKNQGIRFDDYSGHLLICKFFWGELESTRQDEDDLNKLDWNWFFRGSSWHLEKIPVPLYMVFRYFDEVRKSVTSEKIKKQILVHKNSIAVRNHFSSKLEVLEPPSNIDWS